MHPHPHFLLSPLLPHHPYTPRLCRSTTAPLGEGHHPAWKYGHPATLNCTEEDSPCSRLGTAKVERVLPSKKLEPPDEPCCRDPSPVISRPFWRYSDLYLSPYFMPSQEPAFGPVSYLQTCFGPQDAVSDQSPPAHYFRISGLPLVLFPLAPPTRQLNHLISTLSLTQSFRAPTPLFNPDVQCLNFCLSVATHDFLFQTNQFS